MAGRSSIDRLPSAIREEIGRLRQDGATIDEILSHLRGMQVDVSRSAVGRHVQKIQVAGEKLRESRAVAEAVVRGLGDEPDSKVTRLNIELAHSALFRLLASEGEHDPEAMMFLASSIQKLAAAAKTDADLVMRLRSEAAKQAVSAAEKALKEGDGQPIDRAAVLKRIREEVYGIVG